MCSARRLASQTASCLCVYVSRSLLPAAHGGGWGYSASSVEAVRLSPDTDILLGGFGLYGGRGTYNAEIKVRGSDIAASHLHVGSLCTCDVIEGSHDIT